MPMGKFYVFDPHSRDINGMCCEDGKAVITCHDDIDALTSFYKNLAKSTHLAANVPFELVPCIIESVSESDEAESSFSGFDTHVSVKDQKMKKQKKLEKTKLKRKPNDIKTYYNSDSDSDPLEDLISLKNLTNQKRLSEPKSVAYRDVTCSLSYS